MKVGGGGRGGGDGEGCGAEGVGKGRDGGGKGGRGGLFEVGVFWFGLFLGGGEWRDMEGGGEAGIGMGLLSAGN